MSQQFDSFQVYRPLYIFKFTMVAWQCSFVTDRQIHKAQISMKFPLSKGNDSQNILKKYQNKGVPHFTSLVKR